VELSHVQRPARGRSGRGVRTTSNAKSSFPGAASEVQLPSVCRPRRRPRRHVAPCARQSDAVLQHVPLQTAAWRHAEPRLSRGCTDACDSHAPSVACLAQRGRRTGSSVSLPSAPWRDVQRQRCRPTRRARRHGRRCMTLRSSLHDAWVIGLRDTLWIAVAFIARVRRRDEQRGVRRPGRRGARHAAIVTRHAGGACRF